MTRLRSACPGYPRWISRAARIAIAGFAFGAAGLAFAHATIVFGTLSVAPNPPPANVPLTFELTLHDPTGTPVEDAIVRLEIGSLAPGETIVPGEAPAPGSAPDTDAAREPDADLVEPVAQASATEVSPGRYRAQLAVPAAGLYPILIRDQTFRQEEATQIVSMRLGTGERVESIEFILPPTATGGGLGAWLIWLVAIPLVAGVIVTVLVLRASPQDGSAEREAENRGGPG